MRSIIDGGKSANSLKVGNRATTETESGIVASYSGCGSYASFLIKMRGGCALVCRKVATVCFVWHGKLFAVNNAALHHEADIRDGRNVAQRIACDCDHVCEVSGLERTDLSFPSEEFGAVQ